MSCTENVIYKFLPTLAVKKQEVKSVTFLGIEKVTLLFCFQQPCFEGKWNFILGNGKKCNRVFLNEGSSCFSVKNFGINPCS